MEKTNRYPAEVRERAVRMVFEHQSEYESQWAALGSIAMKIGCSAETLRKWVRQVERDSGTRPGLTTDERARLKELDETLGLSASSNAYVRSAWGELAIANRYAPALPAIEAFVTSVGRGLLVYPIYRDLMAQGDWGAAIARDFYAKAKAGYHPGTAAGVAKIIGQ